MDEKFFGITINDLRRLAYDFAVANKIDHRFDYSYGVWSRLGRSPS